MKTTLSPVGRFAPTPSGPLHFGSLVSALGSYLEVKSKGGLWLVRIEDIDLPRVVKGASDVILNTLEDFGLEWDEDVVYQSARLSAYREALFELQAKQLVYNCACSRKDLATSSRRSVTGELFYPGTCREKRGLCAAHCAQRIRVPNKIFSFDDLIQGKVSQNLCTQSGDFVLLRADGVFAYHLAVVVDDAWQGITEVARGSDLLDSTARHLLLQEALGLAQPQYCHFPVVCTLAGEKLSKQTKAAPLKKENASTLLFAALEFLGQCPQEDLRNQPREEILKWALRNWHAGSVSQFLKHALHD